MKAKRKASTMLVSEFEDYNVGVKTLGKIGISAQNFAVREIRQIGECVVNGKGEVTIGKCGSRWTLKDTGRFYDSADFRSVWIIVDGKTIRVNSASGTFNVKSKPQRVRSRVFRDVERTEKITAIMMYRPHKPRAKKAGLTARLQYSNIMENIMER